MGTVLRFSFVPGAGGEVRKSKEFEFRPEPYLKSTAAEQCSEATGIIRCGILNAYLQRPVMVGRPP